MKQLQGKTLCKVEQIGNEELRFYVSDKEYVRMHHEQDCCESVYIEDVVGDLQDLVGSELLVAEERVEEHEAPEDSWDDSYTWTFYTFRTIKGSVDIRWCGSSNGYYSERVDIDTVNIA